MAKFVGLFGSGLAEGALICLVAFGFLLIYKATGVVNFAQGELVTLGAYLALWASDSLGLAIVLAYALSITLMFFVGVAVERAAFAPLRRQSVHVVVISTLGAAIVIRSLISLWQGGATRALRSPIGNGYVSVFGGVITYQRIAIIVVAAVLGIALAVFFAKTTVGRQLRAISDDREMAESVGIHVCSLSMLAFGLSAGLSAVAGVLIAPIGAFDPTLGFGLMFAAFGAATIGGFGSLPGVAAAAVAIGCLEQVFGGYFFRDYQSAMPLILLIAMIVVRPYGLFGVNTSRL
jgi:branched-chain amino acid transport system permease protein